MGHGSIICRLFPGGSSCISQAWSAVCRAGQGADGRGSGGCNADAKAGQYVQAAQGGSVTAPQAPPLQPPYLQQWEPGEALFPLAVSALSQLVGCELPLTP